MLPLLCSVYATFLVLASLLRTQAQLKDLLRERGLKVTGRKAELVQRLLEGPTAGGAGPGGGVVLRCSLTFAYACSPSLRPASVDCNFNQRLP